MRIVKTLSKQICRDLDTALCYAKEALEYKVSKPELADMYYKMAKTNLENAMLLHDQAQKIVGELERSGDEAPSYMTETWEKKHKEAIQKMADTKVFMEMYR